MAKDRDKRKQSKSKTPKLVLVNEFRENHLIVPSHTAHVYARQGNNYFYMNITTSPISKRGRKYVPMTKNPNRNPKPQYKGVKSYFNPEPKMTNRKHFGNPKKDWELHPDDEKEMQKYRLFDFDEKGRPKKGK